MEREPLEGPAIRPQPRSGLVAQPAPGSRPVQLVWKSARGDLGVAVPVLAHGGRGSVGLFGIICGTSKFMVIRKLTFRRRKSQFSGNRLKTEASRGGRERTGTWSRNRTPSPSSFTYPEGLSYHSTRCQSRGPDHHSAGPTDSQETEPHTDT